MTIGAIVAVALYGASGAFGGAGRALNSVYEIEEGRPFWKLRPPSVERKIPRSAFGP